MAKMRLGVTFAEGRGKLGNVVVNTTKYGTVLREKVDPANPQTEAQSAVRKALATSAATYKNMSAAQVEAWEAYASGIVRDDEDFSVKYKPNAINAFVQLAAKFLQVNPGGTLPMNPPTSSFAGDSITLSALAGTGVVTFTASGANATGVTTEILMQRLPGKNRKPQKGAYKHMAFKAFASGSLTQTVNVPTGYYAAGYRFVKTATGQATGITPLPVMTVTLSVSKGESEKKKAAA